MQHNVMPSPELAGLQRERLERQAAAFRARRTARQRSAAPPDPRMLGTVVVLMGTMAVAAAALLLQELSHALTTL